MSAFPRASVALGLAAGLMAATSALAIEAGTPAAAPADPQVTQAVALVSNGVAAKPQSDPSCPSISIAPEGAARSADGAKATLDGLARDCANLGAETIVKVAMVGEGERKKNKAAAAFDTPMTIQIKDGHGRDVETRRINLKVEMAEGVQRVSFRHVEENVSLPPPSADGYANWTIVVGLDPSGQSDDQVAAAGEEQVEAPAKATRSGKSRRSRYARTRSARINAVNTAKLAATTREAQQPGVPLSARSQGGPAAIVTMTTSNSGSSMVRAAENARAIRDKATFDRQVAALQRDRAAKGLPPVPLSAIRRQQPAEAQQPAAGRPQQATRRPQQAAARSGQVQTAQTN